MLCIKCGKKTKFALHWDIDGTPIPVHKKCKDDVNLALIMMTKEAIKLAIDNGYRYYGDKPEWDNIYEQWFIFDDEFVVPSIKEFFLDKEFWICLGKGMNWKENKWKFHWLNLIHYLADDKSIEDFFEELK
jgi:hypothetical protein